MLKLENSIRGLSFSRVAFDLTIQGTNYFEKNFSSVNITILSLLIVPILNNSTIQNNGTSI